MKRRQQFANIETQKEIIAAYEKGLSLRDVAALLDFAEPFVIRVIKGNSGKIRSRSEAAFEWHSRRPASKQWRTCRNRARSVWKRHFGRLPKGMVAIVHHKNGDYTDNRIENLEVMSQADHVRLHKPRLRRR